MLNRGNIYEYPQQRVSVSRYWTEGTTALNCERKVRRIFSHTGTANRCWTVCLLNSDHRIDHPGRPSKQIIQKAFQSLLKRQGWTSIERKKKNSDQSLGSPKYKRSIILLFSTYRKVTRKFNQTQHHHSTTIIRSNLYEVNSSRHYKCKELFTEEFKSILELQNHQIPKVKTGLANHCNNNWRHLSDSGHSTIPFSTQ